MGQKNDECRKWKNNAKYLILIFFSMALSGCNASGQTPKCSNTLEPACKMAWLNYYKDTIKNNNKNKMSEYPYFYNFSELAGPPEALIGNPALFACKTGGEKNALSMPPIGSGERNGCISLDDMNIYFAIVSELIKRQ